MSTPAPCWLALTPAGALKAFSHQQPDESGRALQALLGGANTLTPEEWFATLPIAKALFEQALAQGWIECLPRSISAPNARLDDFGQHVIASLSGERRAVLASETGFCLGRAGVPQDEAETLSAVAADFSDFSLRQARRGWAGAQRYVAFYSDADMLLPEVSLVPFWVDGVGYWIILCGEPLLNNPALVELFWGIQEAGSRFLPSGP
ncbi:hypothetical protein SAMN05216344_103230 [Polaromonas sp. OV174]|uniref:hypothetical protein n=1 Tax=Polaromonas sp. OV174 TaxID=1855300 RepID=UPI0008EAF63F|nr:hypothetical protein [Polaromonas sp. OV174]SFB80736.1 hypothetical protein SAMN05216344_103230 [Polaromonas sp. OV174]